MLKDYLQKQQEYVALQSKTNTLEDQFLEAKKESNACLAKFGRYCRKLLKDSEKEGLLATEQYPTPNHYIIPGTSIGVCINPGDSGISIYCYNRSDYFAIDLADIDTGKTVHDNTIIDTLTEAEKAAIQKLKEFMSI
jgi:hypothetical protein